MSRYIALNPDIHILTVPSCELESYLTVKNIKHTVFELISFPEYEMVKR